MSKVLALRWWGRLLRGLRPRGLWGIGVGRGRRSSLTAKPKHLINLQKKKKKAENIFLSNAKTPMDNWAKWIMITKWKKRPRCFLIDTTNSFFTLWSSKIHPWLNLIQCCTLWSSLTGILDSMFNPLHEEQDPSALGRARNRSLGSWKWRRVTETSPAAQTKLTSMSILLYKQAWCYAPFWWLHLEI